MSEINIFSSAKPQSGEFFKFKNVGDAIQGTYIDQREGIDGFQNPQIIYVLADASGKVWNLGFRKTANITHEKMASVRFGQIIGFKFDEEKPSKRTPGTKIKIINIYSDPKVVDQAWLNQRSALEGGLRGSVMNTAPAPTHTVASAPAKVDPQDRPPFGEGSEEEFGEEFEAPTSASPTSGAMTNGEPQNEALDAIRNLAKTKGLTSDSMSVSEADAIIENYVGLPLTEANLTKVIIKLTEYKK